MTLSELKCQKCGKKLFIFIPRFNGASFNNPMICKYCSSVNIIKGDPDFKRFDYVSMFGSLIFIALVFVIIPFEPVFFKNPFFYIVLVFGFVTLNFSNYLFFKQYITSIEPMTVEEAIKLLEDKDVSSNFHIPKIVNVGTFLWMLAIFVMLCAGIYFNRGEDILIKFLKTPYIYPAMFVGVLLGHLPLWLMKKPLINSMEKQKQKQILKLEEHKTNT